MASPGGLRDNDLMNNPENWERRRKGIYLLPNLFTTGTLFAGFYAIMAAYEGKFEIAAMAVFLGMLADALDGRVARLTNTQSDFGGEYDSLADMVTFGVVPAFVMYTFSLHDLSEFGRFGKQLAWAGAFFYMAMTALRLARFNLHNTEETDKRYFQGLPSPSAAAITMGFVWVADDFGLREFWLVWPSLAITIAAGALMVSNIRYSSFKEIKFSEHVPFTYMLIMVLAFMAVWLDPPRVLFLLFLTYVLSGPALAMRRRLTARRLRASRG